MKTGHADHPGAGRANPAPAHLIVWGSWRRTTLVAHQHGPDPLVRGVVTVVFESTGRRGGGGPRA